MAKVFTEIKGSALNDLIALGYVDAFGNVVSTGRDKIYGFEGSDILHAAEGHDSVWGGSGDDRIYGGQGNDRLYGEDDNDILYGGAGSDRLYGGNGDDALFGGDENDFIRGDTGNDTLYGGTGNDYLYGKKGNNIIFGEDGDDLINSGDHSSTLDGGADDDQLFLRLGKGAQHVATGGTGADEFIFQQSYHRKDAHSTITDFELGIDTFNVDGVQHELYMTLIGADAVSNSNGDALLTFTTGDTVLFQGISESEFESFYGL